MHGLTLEKQERIATSYYGGITPWKGNSKGSEILYKVHDTVLYGTHGVCTIAEITEKTLDGRTTEYYVLKSAYDDRFTIFVPVHNEALVQKMRRILSASEIYELIRSMPDEDMIWIEDESERKERYQKILSGGERKELIKLIKTLYFHQQERKENGKKLHVCDERFFQEAEKMLYEEFAHVLKIERSEVLPLILEQIQILEKQWLAETKSRMNRPWTTASSS